MARTFGELKRRLDRYVDDVVDPEEAVDLFNAAGEVISPYARHSKTSTAQYDKDSEFVALPKDWLETVELKLKLDGVSHFIRVLPMNLVQPSDLVSDAFPYGNGIVGYEQFGNTIEIRPKLRKNGSLLIRYFAALPVIQDLEDIPPIPAPFHDLYPLFGAAKWFQEYQDELQTKRDFWDEFHSMLSELNQYTLDQRAKMKSREVYKFRRWV